MTTPTNHELQSLQAQLAESRTLREQLERTYRNDIHALTQFIGRLGNALRGIDGDLDHRLSKMQNIAQQSNNIDKIIPVMNDISYLLKQQGTRLQKELQNTQTRLLSATKRLQQLKSLPQDTRKELRHLLTQVEGPTFSILQYFPYLNQVLGLYQQSLDLYTDDTNPNEGNHASTKKSAVKSSESFTIGSLKEQLIHLLSIIDFSGDTAADIQNIRQQLLSQMSEEQFMLSCVQVIHLIVQGINEERHSAQSFLQNLNEVLETISSCMNHTLKDSEDTQAAYHQLDAQLDKNLRSLSSSTEKATTLNQLISEVGSHVSVLISTLSQKRNLLHSSHMKLSQQLAEAQSRINKLESEAEEYKERLTEQKFKSLQDSLTRLPNRAAFEERLELEFQRWQRYGTPLAIAITDIDHFKKINDTYGHIAGDKTLQVIASMLKKSLRGTDFVARYGGEEFVMLFPQTEISAILEPLEKARKRIQSIPFKFKNNDITITVSIGAASFNEHDTISSVFERADKALYSAKKTGRNKVIIDSL